MNFALSVKLLVFVLLLNAGAIFSQSAAHLGAGTQDPRKILLATELALGKIQTISYDAVFEGVGHDFYQGRTTGKVRIAKLPASDPMKARIAAQGITVSPRAEQPQPFHATFDGKTSFRLRQTDRSLTVRQFNIERNPAERKFGTATGDMGYGAYTLLLFEIINESPFSSLLDKTILDYEGYTTIEGTRCHVIYIENPSKKVKDRWFIGMQDNLPRRYESVSVNDQGRAGIAFLTLSNLKVNQAIKDEVFAIALPKGFKLKNVQPPNDVRLLQSSTTAPAWKLLDAQGQEHALTEYRGKLVLLDFWATWCGPCVRFMPELQKLHEELMPRGVVVLGINTWEESNAEKYMQEHNYNYGLLLKGETISKDYQVTTIPAVYLIGADGKILLSCIGDCIPQATALIKQQLKLLGR